MEKITKEFKGKPEEHLLLNPDDVSNLKTILDNNLKVIENVKPWDTQEAKDGAIKIIKWFRDLL